MWVTQTYLRSPDPAAKVHIYYLFEDYDKSQKGLTEAIQSSLAALGRRYGRNVTLYMPEPTSTNEVNGELRSMEGLWWSVHGQLPGLLILTRPLEDYKDENPHSFYLPLCNDEGPIASADALAKIIFDVTRITDQQLEFEFANRKNIKPVRDNSDLFDAIEMKPGGFGFRVDLKKLWERYRSR